METVSKMFALVILILSITVIPMYQLLEKQDALVYQEVRKEVTSFTDNVRHKGYITPKMYNDLMERLNLGSNIYDVKMTHAAEVYVPVYTEPSDPNTFQNTWEEHENEFTNTQIFETLFPKEKIPIDDPRRIYYLRTGDTFDVQVDRLTDSMAERLRSFFFQSNESSLWYGISYGGSVLNENY